jgi:hypothetical protein
MPTQDTVKHYTHEEVCECTMGNWSSANDDNSRLSLTLLSSEWIMPLLGNVIEKVSGFLSWNHTLLSRFRKILLNMILFCCSYNSKWPCIWNSNWTSLNRELWLYSHLKHIICRYKISSSHYVLWPFDLWLIVLNTNTIYTHTNLPSAHALHSFVFKTVWAHVLTRFSKGTTAGADLHRHLTSLVFW